MLDLLDFDKVFQVDYGTSGTTIGEVMSQEGQPFSFFCEKLNEANKNI